MTVTNGIAVYFRMNREALELGIAFIGPATNAAQLSTGDTMTSLSERLREYSASRGDLSWQAADEIDRLTAALNALDSRCNKALAAQSAALTQLEATQAKLIEMTEERDTLIHKKRCDHSLEENCVMGIVAYRAEREVERLRLFVEALAFGDPLALSDVRGYAVEALRTSPPKEDSTKLTEAQIKHMVNRFLGWRLPEHFRPDAGISFKPTFNDHLPQPMKHNPSGTNLFDATQAEEMVRYMIEGIPALSARSVMPEQPK